MSEPTTDREFVVRIDFTEVVLGEKRRHTHSITTRASGADAARETALDHFRDLAINSSVGWTRLVHHVEITEWSPESGDVTDSHASHIRVDETSTRERNKTIEKMLDGWFSY